MVSYQRFIMTAYNRVNGAHVSENKQILTDILKKVFQDRDFFCYLVMSWVYEWI